MKQQGKKANNNKVYDFLLIPYNQRKSEQKQEQEQISHPRALYNIW